MNTRFPTAKQNRRNNIKEIGEEKLDVKFSKLLQLFYITFKIKLKFFHMQGKIT